MFARTRVGAAVSRHLRGSYTSNGWVLPSPAWAITESSDSAPRRCAAIPVTGAPSAGSGTPASSSSNALLSNRNGAAARHGRAPRPHPGRRSKTLSHRFSAVPGDHHGGVFGGRAAAFIETTTSMAAIAVQVRPQGVLDGVDATESMNSSIAGRESAGNPSTIDRRCTEPKLATTCSMHSVRAAVAASPP